MRRFTVGDITIEKLAELLVENPNGLLLIRDELSGWFRAFDRKGHESDRSIYLSAYDGKNHLPVDRISRGSSNPILAVGILGGIQPGPLSEYVAGAKGESNQDDGLIQRFQLAAWPDLSDFHGIDRAPDTDARHIAHNLYYTLAHLPISADPDAMVRFGLRTLHFTPEAQDMFNTWYRAHNVRLRVAESPALEAHLTKMLKTVPVLALTFALAQTMVDSGALPEAVDVDALALALAWVPYLRSHAERVYGAVLSPEIEKARTLLAHICAEHVRDGNTLDDITRHHWSGLREPDEVRSAVGVLDTYGWLHVEKVKTAGRPREIVRLNPLARRSRAEGAA